MGTTIAVGAAILLLLVAAWLAYDRRRERVRNAELQVRLILREAELVARRVQADTLMGHKAVIPPPKATRRKRPHYLRPLAVVAGGAVTAGAWAKNNPAAVLALTGAAGLIWLTPFVPSESPPLAAPPPVTSPPLEPRPEPPTEPDRSRDGVDQRESEGPASSTDIGATQVAVQPDEEPPPEPPPDAPEPPEDEPEEEPPEPPPEPYCVEPLPLPPQVDVGDCLEEISALLP